MDCDGLNMDEGLKATCSQCGVFTFAHSICRCLMCGVRHPHTPGCRAVECSQCGLLLKAHRRCRCLRCGRTHLHSASCHPDRAFTLRVSPISVLRQVPRRVHYQALAHVDIRHHDDMSVCEQCGVYALPHSRCRCLLCGCIHKHLTSCRQNQASRLRAAMNGSVPGVHSVGDFDQVCPHCHSRSWRNESISCCASGAIVLPSFPEVPQDLSNLILSPHVRCNIRQYNMAMAMASVGHQNISLPDGMFTLGGKTFHRIGSLRPADTLSHAFAQIYMLDTEEASDRRIRVQSGRDSNNTLRPDVLSQLHSWMLLHNPWVRQFVAASQSDIPRLVWRSSDDISTMQMGALVAQPGSKRDIVIERQVCNSE